MIQEKNIVQDRVVEGDGPVVAPEPAVQHAGDVLQHGTEPTALFGRNAPQTSSATQRLRFRHFMLVASECLKEKHVYNYFEKHQEKPEREISDQTTRLQTQCSDQSSSRCRNTADSLCRGHSCVHGIFCPRLTQCPPKAGVIDICEFD